MRPLGPARKDGWAPPRRCDGWGAGLVGYGKTQFLCVMAVTGCARGCATTGSLGWRPDFKRDAGFVAERTRAKHAGTSQAAQRLQDAMGSGCVSGFEPLILSFCCMTPAGGPRVQFCVLGSVN